MVNIVIAFFATLARLETMSLYTSDILHSVLDPKMLAYTCTVYISTITKFSLHVLGHIQAALFTPNTTFLSNVLSNLFH